jgi:hypothetical protein
MFSEDVVLGSIIVVLGSLALYAACAIGWGFSKEIQPSMDDLFGSHPKKGKTDSPEDKTE